MSDYVLETEHLGCRLGQRYVLKDVTWQVRAGEHWAVYGSNGSGKTTLLSIAAGFKHYTHGTLRLLGQEVTDSNILALRRQVGFVSSSFFDGLYRRESVLDIVLSAKSGGLSVDSSVTLADAVFARRLLASLHLADKVDRAYDMLSKGERQNVLLARALFNRPRLLLLDEPASGLDVYNRAALFHTLETLAPQMTLIYVTHYPEEISPLFGKALLLKQGAVFAQGERRDMVTDETFCRLLDYPVSLGQDDQGRIQLSLTATTEVANLLYRGESS